MLKPLERLKTRTGRWEWCRDSETGEHTYYHVDCDLVTNDDGYCIGCGKASPAAINARAGQTTTEYIIILGLVALGSIAVIMLFGNQVRALFGAGTRKLAGQDSQVDTSYADQSESSESVDDLSAAFESHESGDQTFGGHGQ